MSKYRFSRCRVWSRALRLRHFMRFSADIIHNDVYTHVRNEGRITSRYTFMVFIAVGIATLGLLLNSPAVIIGAMLISPLMGPIMSLGFSLCTVDYQQLKKSLEALLYGVLLALGIAYSIVSFSPISDATPEIMARTQPNLFDLLVAVLSGLAGGYAVVKRKGEAIVGVAIATALMPPLAVTGFGLATSSDAIAKGAFFLFMTNLLAIALSAAFIAKWFGFSTKNSPRYLLWQTTLTISIFVALSMPLGIALQQIGSQAYSVKIARDILNDYYENKDGRVNQFSVNFTEHGMTVNAIVLTRSYDSNANKELADRLTAQLKQPVDLSLDQVVVASMEEIEKRLQPNIPVNVVAAPIQKISQVAVKQQETANAIKNSVFFPVRTMDIQVPSMTATIFAQTTKGMTIGLYRQFEAQLQGRYPEWKLTIVPPLQMLPNVYFETGKDAISMQQHEYIDDITWALNRWEIKEAVVVGYASTVGEFQNFDNTSLAYRRAQHVVSLLENAGVIAHAKAEYRAYKQTNQEREYGQKMLQRVEIRPFQSNDPVLTPMPQDSINTDTQN